MLSLFVLPPPTVMMTRNNNVAKDQRQTDLLQKNSTTTTKKEDIYIYRIRFKINPLLALESLLVRAYCTSYQTRLLVIITEKTSKKDPIFQ